MPDHEKKPKCIYCGNNPVPHWMYWYNESLNILLTPLRQALLYNIFTRNFKKIGLDGLLARILLSTAEVLGIISRRKNLRECKVRRAQVLWEEAEKRGIEMQELLLFGKPIDTYVAHKKNAATENIIFSGLPRPAKYTNPWLDLMDDKWLFKKRLLENGLPVPAGGSAGNFREALKIFNSVNKPVIVKPRSGSRGRHSTTFVYSETDLKKAFKIAQQLCHWVMVEEQLSGPVYRATVIGYDLAGVLRGDPPQIIGDGQLTIKELIKLKNQNKPKGVCDIVPDSSMERFLLRQNYSFSFVPKNGQSINLSEKIGVNYGGSSSEDFEICHPDNIKLFINAAKLLGDPLVGFDFIIPDITKSYKQQKCGFIEVNSLPFINLHHDPLFGNPRNAASFVWKMLNW